MPAAGNDPRVSVIVPTLNEEKNIDALLTKIIEAFRAEPYGIEIIIADGGSTDATEVKANDWITRAPLRFIHARSGRGLAGDVLVAARQARADVVIVMDADLSHPPEVAPLLARPVLDKIADMVIGSRYVKGGGTPEWPWTRRVISRVATLLAWPLVNANDPLSGFFAIGREKLLLVEPSADGFKIALEALLANEDLRVKEIPIVFYDRQYGQSKMSRRQIFAYVRRLVALAGGAVSAGNTMRFAVVGLLGLMVDMGIFHILWKQGVGIAAAHMSSFFAATVLNYLLNSQWAFRQTSRGHLDWSSYLRFLSVTFMALFLRGGVLALLEQHPGIPMNISLVAAIVVASAVNYLGFVFYVFPRAGARPDITWRLAAVGLAGYAVLLRLVYLGLPNLLPEEAYYWNYAQHPALGYLDHPPMVAWLISMGTTVFGSTEFGVRIATFMCWGITAGFCYGFSRKLYGKAVGLLSVMFFALLPGFFVTGFYAFPDAPLIACWAGMLFFLERALLSGRRLAWWGVGLCLGLGMLSKYSIALLVPAVLVFMILDRKSRHWLRKLEPYAALLLAVLLFTPVIVWNFWNGWASFAFQSTRRLRSHPQFSLHLFIGSLLVLLTPLGFFAAVKEFFVPPGKKSRDGRDGEADARSRRFIAVLTLVPLSVFALFSLRYHPKLNWMIPLSLGIIPLLAANLFSARRKAIASFEQRAWGPTLVALALIFGGTLHFLSIGLPGVPYRKDSVSPVAWKEMGQMIEQIEDEVEAQTGVPPLVVGMDKYFIASQMAFYRDNGHSDADKEEGYKDTGSDNLFGGNGLMYAWWFPPADQTGRTLVLVSFKQESLADERISPFVQRFDSMQKVNVMKKGVPAGTFYYRVAYGYRAGNS